MHWFWVVFYIIVGASVLFSVIKIVLMIKATTDTVRQGKVAKKDGRAIKRDKVIYEYTEIFTLQNVDVETVAKALQETSFDGAGVSISGSNGKYLFNADNWTAQLSAAQPESSFYSWQFSFLQWSYRTETYGAMMLAMNITLTAIEKMFLNLDPNTKVQMHKNHTHTVN